MASTKLSVFVAIFFIGLVSSRCMAARTLLQNNSWCVVNVLSGAKAADLEGFIDYACGKYDCSEIQEGGTCYDPNTLLDHVAYALDLVYRNSGFCNTDIGVVIDQDPSTSSCQYP